MGKRAVRRRPCMAGPHTGNPANLRVQIPLDAPRVARTLVMLVKLCDRPSSVSGKSRKLTRYS